MPVPPGGFTRAIVIHKASDNGVNKVPNLLIEATTEFPSQHGKDYAAQAERIHQQNAEALGMALIDTLPGGTVDRLLLFLLEHRVSLLRVAHRR